MGKVFTVDFTRPFMDELLGYIEREHLARGRSLQRLAVVFGGKRPAHFLKRALAHKLQKAFLPPDIFTIEEFIDEVSGAEVPADREMGLENCHVIFQLVRELAPELLQGREDFSRFLPWAADIADLIDQLDQEDVSADVLRNIQESARIGFSVPENINALLRKLILLRRVFHERLAAQGRSSRGLRYLAAKERVADWDSSRYDEIIFANFFYFHSTEEAVVKHLHARGKATLVFQGDQRKWPVLERIAKRFACSLKEGPVPVPVKFDLQAYSAFDVHGEAAVIRDILSRIPDKERTVIVVPDAGSLVPLLSALPEDIEDLNVSMGYPLRRGSIYLLLRSLFGAQLSRRKERYYVKDYLAVLEHPLVKNLRLSRDASVMRVVAHKMEEGLKGRIMTPASGKLFVTLGELEAQESVFVEAQDLLSGMGIHVTRQELADCLKQVHRLIFQPFEELEGFGPFAGALESLLEMLTDKSLMRYYPLNLNMASRLRELCAEFRKASFLEERFSFEQIMRIFEERAGAQMVNFSGTPLKGLQVLGLFETRALNFDHVIVMDVNEGILPRIDSRASLIPHEVMAQLGLDRLELEEEIQRYQFMRLISSARTVHLVYQENKERAPSRFLEELVWQEQQKKGRLDPYPTLRAGFKVRVGSLRREVKKTPGMIRFLKDFAYSASSINAYLVNPYGFYMTYVMGLREQEDLLDEPDAAIMGDFLHRMLEEVYRPFEGKAFVCDASFEKMFWSVFERRFEETFSRRMRADAFLVHGVAEYKMRAFLELERERSSQISRIVAVEKDVAGVIPLSAGDIRFKARIDRIDETAGGRILVLDYKSGSVDKLPRRPFVMSPQMGREEIFEALHSFQLPLYMHFVAKDMGIPALNAGLYSLREARINAIFSEKFQEQPVESFLKPYWQALDAVVSEILDLHKPFVDDDLMKKFDF